MDPELPDFEQTVRITRDAIYIGNDKIPGCIAQGGVTVKPGRSDDINTLTIEFIVGPVRIDDPWVQAETIETPAESATKYDVVRPDTELVHVDGQGNYQVQDVHLP